MKNKFFSLALILITLAACGSSIRKIPAGTWKYRLLVNGADMGHAVITNEAFEDRYVSTMDMEMNAGYVSNRSRQVVVETHDFRPLKLEVHTTTTSNGRVTELKTVAVFNGNRVELDADGARSVITVSRPFILEGNYFMNELIKSGFKKGTVLRHHIYEPSVDIDEPVLVIVKVIGKERIEIRGKMEKLVHIGYSIENLKNIDVYIDESGVTQKTVITMLNNRLELVRE